MRTPGSWANLGTRVGRFCHPSAIACGPLPGHTGRPAWWLVPVAFSGVWAASTGFISVGGPHYTSFPALFVFGILSSSAETKLILGAQGELKTCHDLTSCPSWDVAPARRVCFPLLLFLSAIDWHYLGCQWDHAGICYHVFHESSWFGVESPYNLLSKLRGFRVKGDAVNYSSSTGISQNCLRQTRKYGHPS